jgi:hypothetical protein
MRIRLRIVLLAAPLLCALSAGCATLGPPVDGYPEVVYQCEDGRWFQATMTPSRATVRLSNGRRYQLSGHGEVDRASYTDGRVRFYAGRQGAVLVTPQERYSRCWLTET